MPTNSPATELEATLRHLAGDRSADPTDRALAAAFLAMAPRLRSLFKFGYGRITGVVSGSKVKRVEATYSDNVEE